MRKRGVSVHAGLTIPELLVVITILSILSTIAFLSFAKYGAQSRDVVRLSDIKNITKVLALHNNHKSRYPSTSSGVDVTYSGSTLWSQGVFGTDTMKETGKIFGELIDPQYENQYTYSVTNNKKEYQLAALFEGQDASTKFIAGVNFPDAIPSAYAADPFDPLELSPKIWLDAYDVDGDGDTGDNPSDESVIITWVNKSSAGSANNPITTGGDIEYATSGLSGSYPGVYIDNDMGLLLNNSDITSGDIFYVVDKKDPFGGSTDSDGRALQGANGNYLIGYHGKYRDSIYINGSPNDYNSSPATKSNRTKTYIYGFHTDNINYAFYRTGELVSQGATNSISGINWAFNEAGWASNETSEFVVSEILIFDTKLDSADREKIEGYLAHKWGKDGSLPNSHPYKDEPPESSGPPPTPDTTPDAFILSDVTDANLSTVYISNTISVTGINTNTPISVTAGEYNINGGTFVSTAGTVSLGDTVSLRLTSSSSNSTAVASTLDIGGVQENYSVTTLIADTTPDSFTFSPVIGADVNTEYSSNTITVSGLNVSVPISISGVGAEYKISDGVPYDVTSGGSTSASSTYWTNDSDDAFDNNTSSTGWGNNGSIPAWLKYDLGSGNDKVVSKYTLYRDSGQDGGWNSWRYSPSNWTFEGSNDNSNWTILDTRTNESISADATKKEYSFSNNDYYRYYRINISSADNGGSWVNITEMELIDEEGSGSFTSLTSNVSNGDIITVKMPSSNTAGTLKSATLTIGTSSSDFDITTTAPDGVPDNFNFSDVTNASLSTVYESNSITVSGINTSTLISISGSGEYKINGGSYTTSAGSVSNGDVIQIRQTSSASNSVTISSILDIGGVTATYNVTTPAPPPDTTPDIFAFSDVPNANLSTDYTSNSITISGINTATSLSISGGEYDVNDSKSYTSTPTTINNGDVISLKNTSSASPSTTTSATLIVGGVSDTYSITTIPPDTSPDTFSIGDISDAVISSEYISDPVTVSGINTGTSISISAGGEYSINGSGVWTSSAGTVYNGDTFIVRQTSSSSWSTPTSVTLTVGGQSDGYIVTTGAGDTIPDAFSFMDITDANLNSQYISSTITVTGLNAPSTIAVSGGEYRVGALGAFTSFAGTVTNNDEVTVRLVSSISGSSTTSALLNIGGITDSYDVTTQAYSAPSGENSTTETSGVFVTGNYNGLIAYTSSGSSHYIIATPSIIAYDLSNTDVIHIIENKKLVYNGFDNIPASYSGANLTMSGGFDFTITSPLLYSGSKEDLGSYGGLKLIDEGVRSTYNDFPAYEKVASYLDDYSLGYLETIIGENIGINPIKPFYCSDILQSKLIYNVAPEATISASPSAYNSYGTSGITNGIKSTTGDLDYEYHSADGNATIEFEWAETQRIGYVRIYNRVGCCSDRLSGATVQLYNQLGGLIYSHPLWDTTDDYVIDLDLEGIGHLYNVKKLAIQTVGGNLLNLREVEIFLGGNVEDGIYKVDKDGLGGQSPYNVYCDMTTDGGGWTRIGEDYIHNGDFGSQNHVEEHTFTGYNNVSDNLIVAHSTKAPPSYIPDAFVLQHNGSITESYPLYFPSIPGEYFAQEIRVSAWVDGTNSSIFSNTVNYDDGSSSTTNPDYEVIEEIDGWQHRRVRIPLTGLVSDFTWNMGLDIAGPFYVTGMKMEVYYR